MWWDFVVLLLVLCMGTSRCWGAVSGAWRGLEVAGWLWLKKEVRYRKVVVQK